MWSPLKRRTLDNHNGHVDAKVFRKACWIIGTNALDPTMLSDQDLVTTYKEQGGVESGFRFLKDPLFLALFNRLVGLEEIGRDEIVCSEKSYAKKWPCKRTTYTNCNSR